jgi:segregation and condensation protein A
VWTLSADDFVRLAAEALRPRPVPEVATGHLHAPLVTVDEQRLVLLDRLGGGLPVPFSDLLAGSPDSSTVVARFLALLDLYRDGVVTVDQEGPLGEIVVQRVAREAT